MPIWKGAMQPLPELQAQLARSLRDPAAPLAGIRANGLGAGRRLQVYRHNYESALVSALRAVYPVTERLVGEDFFIAAATVYVKQHPSHSGNIQEYGDAFPSFLDGYAPAATLPYLGDVASLEWRRLQAALAPTHTSMDLQALGQVSAETLPELYFHPQPAVRVFESRFPVLSIWEFCQQAESEGELDLDLGAQSVLISRPDLDVRMRLLSAGEQAFLVSICRGLSFADACQAGLDVESGFDVQACFSAAVRDQILTGFYL
jgi:hypothetical protein